MDNCSGRVGPAGRILRVGVLVLVAPLLMAGCGDDSEPIDVSSTGVEMSDATAEELDVGMSDGDSAPEERDVEVGPVDVCALLGDDELEVVTGYAVASSAPGAQFGIFADGCRWQFDDMYLGVAPELLVGVKPAGGASYYDRYFAPFVDENGYEVVSGVGDAALRDEFGGLLVLSGDVLLNVQYLDERPDTAADDLALVELLLAAL